PSSEKPGGAEVPDDGRPSAQPEKKTKSERCRTPLGGLPHAFSTLTRLASGFGSKKCPYPAAGTGLPGYTLCPGPPRVATVAGTQDNRWVPRFCPAGKIKRSPCCSSLDIEFCWYHHIPFVRYCQQGGAGVAGETETRRGRRALGHSHDDRVVGLDFIVRRPMEVVLQLAQRLLRDPL